MSRKKSDEDEPSIELRIVLVDKSFRQTNGDVSLSLVTVDAQPSEKIASLKATLRRFSGRIVLSLFYRGVRCEPSRSVDYYRGLGTDGLWQARLMEEIDQGQSKIAVDIMNDSKKTVLMVPSLMSVLSFKDIIHHRLGFPPQEQHILVNNKSLSGIDSLKDYVTEDDDSTSMVLLYQTEADVELSRKYVRFSRHLVERIHRTKRSDALMHCEVVSGLNIEGVCCTPSCRAFGQNAIYALGQEVFDMCIDAALCPCCKEEMHISNAGFHDCAWRIQGVKKNGDHMLNVKTISRQTGDEYVRCDPSKCRTPGKWHRLMLQAVPLKCALECVVCHSRIDTDDYLTSLCGEYIHPTCYQAWKQVDPRCPSCLQPLET